MLLFILKRLALAIPTLLVILAVVFWSARLTPSDPVDIIAGEKASLETKARMRHEYGLDRPVGAQFVGYVQGTLRGDFGRAYRYRNQQPVSEMIRQDFPVTAQLALQSLLFAAILGLAVGILAALYHNRWFDRAAMTVVVALVSVPSIVLGPLLVLAFAVKLHFLPVSGWKQPANQVFLFGFPTPIYTDTLLPTLTLGARSAALVARFMRGALLEVLRQDYMRTALAKGLSRAQAVRRHALKNAFLPVLTILGTNFGLLLTGSFVVETIFRVPGIGRASYKSIIVHDYPVIQGMTLLVAAIFLIVNLAVDVLYGLIDPRVRAQGAA